MEPIDLNRQRLEQRQAVLNSEWSIRIEKIGKLRQALAIEANTERQFQLEQQIQVQEGARESLESELSTVEQALNSAITSSQSLQPIVASSNSRKMPHFGVREDVQHLIEIHATTTVRVEKEVNWNRSKYKCYDASGNYLGQVKGKLGNRYWEER